jgi:hypothetical protein
VATQPPVDLEELAQRLRAADHLGSEAQEAVADLVEELGKTLSARPEVTAGATHLAESAAHLARALHERHDVGLIAAARQRLEAAVTHAELEAPLASGIARRLIETLANLGI